MTRLLSVLTGIAVDRLVLFFILHTLVWVCLSPNVIRAQVYNRPIFDTLATQGVRYRVALNTIAATAGQTPFWLRSDQFGTIPWQSPTGAFSAGATGIWGNPKLKRRVYLKAGVELVANVNTASQLLLPEGYAALRLGHVEIYAGRRKEINGLTDTLLTSGSVNYSGNALPIPQVRIGTIDFAPLHFTRDFVSVNAFISEGWFANTDSMQRVRLHYKSLFIRLGKPQARIRLYGGVNHAVQWGGYSKYLPAGLAKNGYLASNWPAFWSVVFPVGRIGTDNRQLTTIDTLNQVGNHLGSIDLAFDINLKQSNVYGYYQHVFEDDSGIKFQNFPDGLWGVRWRKVAPLTKKFVQLRQVTAEFLTSLNRSGTDPVFGGDDYFYNGQYIDGWTHKGSVIGTPIFTRTVDIPASVRKNSNWLNRTTGEPNTDGTDRTRPVNNNAVRAIHLGLYGLLGQRVPLVLMVTSCRYYDWERPANQYDQFYGSLSVTNLNIQKSSGLQADVKLAFDSGQIFSNNLGLMFTLKKQGFMALPRQRPATQKE